MCTHQLAHNDENTTARADVCLRKDNVVRKLVQEWMVAQMERPCM